METVSSKRSLGQRADPAAGAMLGWMLCAAVSGVAIQRTDPLWGGRTAAIHLAVAIGHLLGAGLLAAALAWAHAHAAPRGRWFRRLAVAGAGAAAAWLVLPDDLSSFATRVRGTIPPEATIACAVIAAGLLLALAVELGRAARRRRRRIVAVVLAAAVAAIEPRVLPGQYPGLHFLLVLGAASFAGAALTGVALPRSLGRRARAALLLVAAPGLLSYLVPVGEDVHFRVARDGDVVVQIFGRYLPREETHAPAVEESAWLRPRAGLPDVPPTAVARAASQPIVVLLTVDCMRYDVVDGARVPLPHLARLRAEGAHFRRAHTPGSSTVYVLTSIFSGKYFSQLEWSAQTTFPSDDPTPRFPELLAREGVWTVHAASFDWLDEPYGVARGFSVVDYRQLPGPRWKPAESLADALITRLGQVRDRPAFLYAHFNDPHLPYDRGGTHGTAFERYGRELALVDAQIGRVLDAIDRLGLRSRTTVIVTADHGEAFGEHGRYAHAGSLYQELTHVPLLVSGPGIGHRAIPERVSLIDLGPTILDLFGQPTPASFMGESFFPALIGRPFAPTRPLAAQAGRLRSWITPEGLEVIRDERRGTAEAYDLVADPRELHNLIGEGRADVQTALGTLDAFFRVHQFRRPGYVEPFR